MKKKSLFGGKLKDPIGFVVGLCIVSFTSIFVGVSMIIIVLGGNKDSWIGIIIAVLSFIIGIGHPIVFFIVVKNRKKYPRLSKLLVKPGYFIDE